MSDNLQFLPIYLAGATAVGKSAVAIELAKKIGGEIISVDSMQVYRGLDLGTAKPTESERNIVSHHLIDVAELNESFDAARFVQLADAAISDIQKRGRVPILCGGTGFYFKALLDGLGTAPASDPEVRRQLTLLPLPALLVELQERDPVTYEKIDRQNPRRVIRALEVIRVTGQPYSTQRAAWQIDGSRTPNYFGLRRASSDLQARINARVETMFQQGLVNEVKTLLALGLEKNPTAMQAIGYRQVVEHLRGQRGLEETIELVKIRTRQFAKRQMTWFRRHANLQWVDCTPEETVESIVARIGTRAPSINSIAIVCNRGKGERTPLANSVRHGVTQMERICHRNVTGTNWLDLVSWRGETSGSCHSKETVAALGFAG